MQERKIMIILVLSVMREIGIISLQNAWALVTPAHLRYLGNYDMG